MSLILDAATATDFYKTGHIFQYPKDTDLVYSNFTARSDRLAQVVRDTFDQKIVFFGFQGFAQWFLIDLWNITFFSQPKEKVVAKYKRMMDFTLGKDSVPVDHIEALHDLGYLPVRIKALPEGSRVDIKVPVMTMVNTHPQFYWVTNYLETVISNENWKSCTTATTAYEYKRMLQAAAERTGTPLDFVMWQGHDFAMRGMSGLADASTSNAGHLLSFFGTDTIPAIEYLENYYGANVEKELVGASIPATEHSVMCMGGEEDELGTFKRLITEVYPSGGISIVSDTWDFWHVITETAKTLKPEIMARTPDANGLAKVVFRPDSGDPVKILTGYKVKEFESLDQASRNYWMFDEDAESASWEAIKADGKYYKFTVSRWPDYSPSGIIIGNEITEAEAKGAVQCLWDIFGGAETEKGFKLLDQHVGLIYGDSITLDRAKQILERLADKGFASGNVVFGIGSFTYQYVTRDNFGFAVKSTYGSVKHVGRELFKDPKTDDGVKRSAKGLIRVEQEGGTFTLHDQQTWEQEALGRMEVVFEDGKLRRFQTLNEIRSILAVSHVITI